MDKKLYGKILVYDISYKAMIGVKPLCIRFDKIDGFIRDYDGIKYLVLFGPEKHVAIFQRIRYLRSKKCDITFLFLIIMQKSKFIFMILYL